MEIIYPNDFVRFFNEDEEVDEVGEFEVLPEDTENSFERYYTGNDDTFNYNYPMNYRNSDNDSKFSVIPPVIKNIPDNIANVPAVIQDLPYAIKDMGNDLMHSAPVGYMSNMLPIPTNWQSPQSPSPMGPPPSYIPSKKDAGVQNFGQGSGNPNAKNVSSGSIRFCLYRFTYIWQTNGRSYWAYLTRVDKKSVSGWRWAGFRWVYFGVDLKRIDSFICY